MAKTNRRRSNSRQYSRRPASSSGGLKWVLLGVMLGALGMFFVWQHQPHAENLLSNAQSLHTKLAQKKHIQQSPAHKPRPASEYDFYTMLPKMEVKAVEPRLPAAPVAVQKNQSPKPPEAPAIVNHPAKVSAPAATPLMAELVPLPATEVAETPKAKSQLASRENYIVQVANIKDYAQADRLKAELTMLGFDVVLQDYTVNGQTWNRVLAGSFSSKSAAIQQQKRLKQNNISSTLIRN